MAINKKYNSYQKIIDPKLYEKIPKAVFAAMTVSLMLIINDEDRDRINDDLKSEWTALYKNKIVPQKPNFKM